MKRPAAIALLTLGSLAGPGLLAGCGQADEPTHFTPPSADAPAAVGAGRDRGPAAERSAERRIEMH